VCPVRAGAVKDHRVLTIISMVIIAWPMSSNVAFLATDVGRLFRKRFNVAARRLGVTGPQWRMLAAIRRTPGINQNAIAQWLEVEAITAGRMVDRLQKAGLVERRDDPADRRSWRLYLTAQADRHMEHLAEFADGVFAEALAGIGPTEQALLLSLLERVRANLSQTMPEEAQAAPTPDPREEKWPKPIRNRPA
jgi:DNA-binding MarR family transcriptional regulator